jgi:hypothetical protein
MFLSCGGTSLAMGRFLVQGALAVSVKLMVSEILNLDITDSLSHRRQKKKKKN